MAGEDKEQIFNQKHRQASIRRFAVRVAAPATGAASEITLMQFIPSAAQTTAGVTNPNAIKILRVEFIPDVAVSAAGGTNYGTLTIGQRAGATGVAGTALTGSKDNQAALTAFQAYAIVSTAQTVAAGQVLTLINTPTASGGAWQAGCVVVTTQE